MIGRRARHPGLMLVAALAIVTGLPTGGAASRSTVDDLQARVRAAAAGETITVAPGTYRGPLVIDRPLRLVAAGAVVIEGPGEGDVIDISAPDVTVRGFTIRGTGESLDRENAAVVVTAPRVTIEDNRIEDALFGIYLKAAPGSVIRGNRIGGKDLPEPRRGDAIRLWQSPDCFIEDNEVRDSRDLIMWFSNDVTLRRNRVSGGRYGMHFMYSSDNVLEDNVLTDNSVGAFLMYSRNLTLRRNVLARNRGPSGFGIGLKDMDGLVTEDNIIIGNRVGVHLDNSPSEFDVVHVWRRNLVAYNDIGIAFLPNVERNRFTENTFIDNVEQVAILGSGTLRKIDFAVDGRGNFWSDYRGYDLDDDGIGETVYHADDFFENLIDRSPRMRLFLFSPAQHALEMAARAFPVVLPRPKISDASPLMRMVEPRSQATASVRRPGSFAGVVLLLAGVACMAPALGRAERRLATAVRSGGSGRR
ncbi:MAG: nitrous oxide reductase family maturation protein NosD [Phycisphaerales bacterium]|nr:nitrous oxide reductase family maturation protein NosD [Phycisphaerales bacterium]